MSLKEEISELMEKNLRLKEGKPGFCPYCGSGYYKHYLEFKKTAFDYRFKMKCGDCSKDFYECHIGNKHWTLGI